MSLSRRACLLAAARPRLDRSRLSIITDEVGRLSEAIAFARGYRLRWVELRGEPGEGRFDAMPAARLKETARRLHDAGLRASFLNSALLKFALPGTLPARREVVYDEMWARQGWTPESMWRDRLSHLNQSLDAAAILGIKQIRTFTFWRVEQPREVFPRVRDVLEDFGAVAAKRGQRVLVENEFSCSMGSSAETAELLAMVKSPGVALNWDPQNSVEYDAGGVFPGGWRRLPRKRIANVQMKAEGLLGPGAVLDWEGMVRELARGGYAGLFGLETRSRKGPEENVAVSRRCMEMMIRMVEGTL